MSTSLGRAVVRITICLVILTSGACSRGQTNESTEIGGRDIVSTMPYTVVARGAVSITYKNSIPIRIREINDPRFSNVPRVLFVFPKTAVNLDPKTKIEAGVIVGGYRGNGAYDVGSDRASASLNPADATQLSKGSLDIIVNNRVRPFRQGRCHVVLEEDGQSGRMKCARLKDEFGKVISLDVRWGTQVN